MSTGYKIVDTGGLYYLTFQVVDWVDIFTRRNYRDMVLESLAYCIKEKGLIVHSYVIMSNHLHLIVRSKNGNLSEIIRDMKKYTSKAIIKMI
jgi:REP element-mobilizing transposase RayT